MKRLLCITANMNSGGAETFLMKVFRRLNQEKYGMDFCVNTKINDYQEEILSLGGKIYYVPAKSKHPVKSFWSLRKIVKENKYDYVIRVNEHALATIDLLAAKTGGAKVLAMRSSNTASDSKLKDCLHKLFRPLTITIPNVRFAPSTEAAEYTFGRNCIINRKARLVHNGVDLNFYRFNRESRNKVREEFGIADEEIVIGHIGRFNTQKNHLMLVDIFNEFQKSHSNSKLLLVGIGTLQESIRKKVISNKIEDKVIFANLRNDIPDVLSAMDVFVFPSFFEGMPNTVIEAQATGLPCVISNTITRESNITDLVSFVPLDVDLKIWISEIESAVKKDRTDTKSSFIEHKYDIDSVVKDFIRLVFGDE